MAFDLVLRGGDVLDGSGAPAIRADVAVSGDRIAAVGDLTAATAAATVDIAGATVTPGFIDAHTHTDLSWRLSDAHADIKFAGIRQGVTTEVCGNCGISPFPCRPGEVADRSLPELENVAEWFTTIVDYRAAMAAVPIAANLAPLVGHGRIRSAVVGDAPRNASGDEIASMTALVAEALDAGAFGVSSGLAYSPGAFADTAEIVAIAREAARFNRPYTTHMRDEGDDVEAAIWETLEVARASGVAVEISHHKVGGAHNWGRSTETLRAIDRARAQGLDITIDAYPYTAASTFVVQLLPASLRADGIDAAVERLRHASVRDDLAVAVARGVSGWGGVPWSNVMTTGAGENAGVSIAALAQERGRREIDVVADLVIADPATVVIVHMMNDDEVVTIGDQPYAMVGSDGVPLPGMQHPRLAGTFARVLSRHRASPHGFADAVRRMTSLPAHRFGIPDRGLVEVGKVADLVVLRPDEVRDTSTYERPTGAPLGIDHVLVGGRFALRAGELGDVNAGQLLEPQ